MSESGTKLFAGMEGGRDGSVAVAAAGNSIFTSLSCWNGSLAKVFISQQLSEQVKTLTTHALHIKWKTKPERSDDMNGVQILNEPLVLPKKLCLSTPALSLRSSLLKWRRKKSSEKVSE